MFTLRLRDTDKAIVSDTPVPLRTLPERPIRVLLLGAPAPENKYLRRWAEDLGIDLVSQLDAGGGVRLGDKPIGLAAGTLRQFDAVIIDDRTWSAVGGARGTIASAVANGLGLIVRMTGPASPALRRDLQAVGMTIAGGSDLQPVALPPLTVDADAQAAQQGPGSEDVSASLNTADDPAPELGRYAVQAGAEVVPAVTDETGAMLVGWRQRGQGRVALWTIADSFALVLGGQADRYYQWWSSTLSAVVRPARIFHPEVSPLPRAGERIAICGLSGTIQAVDPGGSARPLLVDPAAGARGCAGYWPRGSGIHSIVQVDRGNRQTMQFYVYPSQGLRAAIVADMAESTKRWAARQDTPNATPGGLRRGPPWPWFAAWLLATGLLYYLERRWRRLSRTNETA